MNRLITFFSVATFILFAGFYPVTPVSAAGEEDPMGFIHLGNGRVANDHPSRAIVVNYRVTSNFGSPASSIESVTVFPNSSVGVYNPNFSHQLVRAFFFDEFGRRRKTKNH
jgi:hypothetical protein